MYSGNTLRKIEDCDPKIQSQSSQKIEDYDRFRSPRLKIEDYEKAIVVLIVVLVVVLTAVLNRCQLSKLTSNRFFVVPESFFAVLELKIEDCEKRLRSSIVVLVVVLIARKSRTTMRTAIRTATRTAMRTAIAFSQSSIFNRGLRKRSQSSIFCEDCD